MKILHIVTDVLNADSKQVIELQSKTHDTEVVELGDKETNYDELIEKIEKCDKVISW